MTNLTQYEKSCSSCSIQHKYGLTYVQGYELAERLKKTQELELEVRRENAQLKELLKECFNAMNEGSYWDRVDMLHKIDQVLGEE